MTFSLPEHLLIFAVPIDDYMWDLLDKLGFDNDNGEVFMIEVAELKKNLYYKYTRLCDEAFNEMMDFFD